LATPFETGPTSPSRRSDWSAVARTESHPGVTIVSLFSRQRISPVAIAAAWLLAAAKPLLSALNTTVRSSNRPDISSSVCRVELPEPLSTTITSKLG